MSSKSNDSLLPSSNLDSATILTAFEVSELAYDSYDASTNLLMTKEGGVLQEDTIEKQLVADGWQSIDADGEDVSSTSFQGDAFVKEINGVTEVIVGFRGSQTAHDFLVSDAQLAVGSTPDVDYSADAYFKSVVKEVGNWITKNNSGPANYITTGHSLGGQEADYVNVFESGFGSKIETVSFDAPGVAKGLATSSTIYDALNISVSKELVHVFGSLLNAGYVGDSVTVDAGAPVLPYFAVGLLGTVLSGGTALAAGGFGVLLSNGFYLNHKGSTLASYFLVHPALGGVDLETYAPDMVQQSAVDAFAKLTPADYLKMSSADKAKLYSDALVSMADSWS